MFKKIDRKKVRQKKHLRIRKHIKGTPEKPRLAVFRSLKHIHAQIIDDKSGTTIVSASSLDAAVKEGLKSGCNVEAGKKLGEILAKKALEKGISTVVFDRGGYLYHGRIKAVAEGAREAGLKL